MALNAHTFHCWTQFEAKSKSERIIFKITDENGKEKKIIKLKIKKSKYSLNNNKMF